MKANGKKAIILAVLFLFFILFSNVFIIAESNHDCDGEDCAVCRIVEATENALKKFSVFSVSAAVFSAALFAAIIAVSLFVGKRIPTTLVSLKVKLSD